MKDYNLQDEFTAKPITENEVNEENITLSVTGKYEEVNFDEDSFAGAASKVISSTR